MRVMVKLKRCVRSMARHVGRKEFVRVPLFEGSLVSGRRALVTGGTSGIGYAIAEALLRNGAVVVVTGRDASRIGRSVDSLKKISGGRAYGVVLDNSDVEGISPAIDASIGHLGGAPDILVNNAGVNDFGRIGKIDAKSFEHVMSVNLLGATLISQEVAVRMVCSGARGSILNIASSSSVRPAASAYAMSKWGLRGLTLGMAKSLAPYGITVNALAPGPTATSMLMGDEAGDVSRPVSSVGRYIAPEEVANMAVVLVSDLGRMVVGDTVYMTGGSGVITFDDGITYDFVGIDK